MISSCRLLSFPQLAVHPPPCCKTPQLHRILIRGVDDCIHEKFPAPNNLRREKLSVLVWSTFESLVLHEVCTLLKKADIHIITKTYNDIVSYCTSLFCVATLLKVVFRSKTVSQVQSKINYTESHTITVTQKNHYYRTYRFCLKCYSRDSRDQRRLQRLGRPAETPETLLLVKTYCAVYCVQPSRVYLGGA